MVLWCSSLVLQGELKTVTTNLKGHKRREGGREGGRREGKGEGEEKERDVRELEREREAAR